MMHKVHNYLRNFVLTIVCLFITLWCSSVLEYDSFFQLTVCMVHPLNFFIWMTYILEDENTDRNLENEVSTLMVVVLFFWFIAGGGKTKCFSK